MNNLAVLLFCLAFFVLGCGTNLKQNSFTPNTEDAALFFDKDKETGEQTSNNQREDINPKLKDFYSLLAQSKAQWELTKANISNTYSYVVHSEYPMVAGWNETKIFVKDGIAKKRSTRSDSIKHWHFEEDLKKGVHEEKDFKTLDDFYDTCEKKVLTRSPECNTIILQLFTDGLILDCVIIPCGVADVTSIGVSIENIDYINKPQSVKPGQSYKITGCPNHYDNINPNCHWLEDLKELGVISQ